MAQSKEEKYIKDRAYRKKNKAALRAKRAKSTHARYIDLKGRARRLGRNFRIAYKTYDRMITSGCFYCGASLMDEIGGSLDRINNDNRSYTTQNVVPCCKKCNYVKSNVLTMDETIFVMEMLKRLRAGEKHEVQVCAVTKRDKAEKRKVLVGRKSNASRSGKRRGAE